MQLPRVSSLDLMKQVTPETSFFSLSENAEGR